jgi:hypothetical protein
MRSTGQRFFNNFTTVIQEFRRKKKEERRKKKISPLPPALFPLPLLPQKALKYME